MIRPKRNLRINHKTYVKGEAYNEPVPAGFEKEFEVDKPKTAKKK